MSNKVLIRLFLPLVIAAPAAMPAAAQAEQTLVSSASNSLCVEPHAFDPSNTAEVYTEHVGGPFPDTGAECAAGSPVNAVPMGSPGGPGAEAYPYDAWIPLASWVSYNSTGQDRSNGAPQYYIYDETFTLHSAEAACPVIEGDMYGDNTVGVFLNGHPLENLSVTNPPTNHENFSTENHNGGWSFGTGAKAAFNLSGTNVLQFVVLDQSEPYTALDFNAAVRAPCSESPSPPTAVTERASPAAGTSATLNATVNPNDGTVTKCEFQYGPTNTYGSIAMCTSLPGSQVIPILVSSPSIMGLTTGATYHFRICATNASGTSCGSDQTFTVAAETNWYSEGAIIPVGEQVPTISWGNLTLVGQQTGQEISCHNAIGGYVENPAGGGAGIDVTEAFATWDCVINYTCPAGTRGGAAPSLLPWTGTLEEVSGKIRSVASKVIGAGGTRVIIGCTAPIFSNADFPEPPGTGELTQGGVFVVGAQTSEPLAPAGAKKGTGALHPGFFEWDSGSGLLEEEEANESGHGNGTITGKTSGTIKTLGFEHQEHVYAEKD